VAELDDAFESLHDGLQPIIMQKECQLFSKRSAFNSSGFL
jgi:hypothetical protein